MASWLFFTTVLLLGLIDFGYGQTCTMTPITKICDKTLPPLIVTYPEIKRDMCADDVKVMDKMAFKTEPKVVFPKAEENTLYTLLFHDLDARNHTEGESAIFWLVNNIPGKDLAVGNLEKGFQSCKYFPLTPKDGSGPHRYFFHVFSQKAPIAPKLMDTYELRGKFRIAKYAADYGLCGPKAINLVRAQSQG